MQRLGMPEQPSTRGRTFTRYAIALARAAKTGGDLLSASAFVDSQCRYDGPWRDSVELPGIMRALVQNGGTPPEFADPYARSPQRQAQQKAAVAAGTTTDSVWAAPLAAFQNMTSEFVALLRPATILGKLGARALPFNVAIPRVVSGTNSAWVGAGLPTPASAMAFETATLSYCKIATIVALSDALVRFSDGVAEEVIRDDLVRAIAQYIDQQLVDVTVTASPGIRPASLTNTAPQVVSTGSTAAAIIADLQSLFAVAVAGNVPFLRPALIMLPRTALFLATLQTTSGGFLFPALGALGGSLMGIPVITSSSVPIESGGTSTIILIDAAEVFVADDGVVTLDVSTEASLQMDGAPSAGAQSLVSLWQNNEVGLRATRYISWARRVNASVVVLVNVAY